MATNDEGNIFQVYFNKLMTIYMVILDSHQYTIHQDIVVRIIFNQSGPDLCFII